MADDQTLSGSPPLLTPGIQLRERWEILKKIGGGGFGEIYKAKDLTTGQTCAVKVESCISLKQVLKMEVAVLKRLQGMSSHHVCQFIGCGRNDTVNYVVMTLLGPSLSELRKRQPNQHFSISTTLRIGIQIIEAIRAIHDSGFLHRDIKPSNFAIGSTPCTSRTCVMFDFGLARQYTTLTGEVRQPRIIAGFRGTVRYASINAHQSKDLGRHDDLWSVFYLLVELAVGLLPWRKIKDKEEAGEFKAHYNHKDLITNMPIEFEAYLEHLESLSYSDKPDYSLVTNQLTTAIKRLRISSTDLFDWEQDYNVPSLATASVGSPPAIKTQEVDNKKEVDREKVILVNSKTNCSEVVELGINDAVVHPGPDQQTQLLVPVSNRVFNQQTKDCDVIVPAVETNPGHVDKIIPGGDKVSGNMNRELSEFVDVENKYESEEESESSLTESSVDDEQDVEHLIIISKPKPVNNLIVQEQFNGISSIQTDSLDRFFDLCPNVQKGSLDSDPDKLPREQQSRDHQNNSGSKSHQTAPDSESSLELEEVDYDSLDSVSEETGSRQIFVHTENKSVPMWAYATESEVSEQEPTNAINSTKQLTTEEHKTLEPSVAEGEQEVPMKYAFKYSNILRESDSYKSVQGSSSSVAKETTPQLETEVQEGSRVSPRAKLRVLSSPPSVQSDSSSSKKDRMRPLVECNNVSALTPIITPIASSLRVSDYSQIQSSSSLDTTSPNRYTVVRIKVPIFESKIRVLPHPPSQPLPTNYQSFLSARRRRFLRSQIK